MKNKIVVRIFFIYQRYATIFVILKLAGFKSQIYLHYCNKRVGIVQKKRGWSSLRVSVAVIDYNSIGRSKLYYYSLFFLTYSKTYMFKSIGSFNHRLFVYLFDGALRHFQQYFRYIVAVSFIGGGNRSTRRKPTTCRKSLTTFIT